jgi:hypothetical protein
MLFRVTVDAPGSTLGRLNNQKVSLTWGCSGAWGVTLESNDHGTIWVKLGFRCLPRLQLGTSVISIGVPLPLPVESGLYNGCVVDSAVACPHRTLGDTSDDLHGSGRLFAAATSRSLMGDLFVANRIALVRPIYIGMAVMVRSTPNPC